MLTYSVMMIDVSARTTHKDVVKKFQDNYFCIKKYTWNFNISI